MTAELMSVSDALASELVPMPADASDVCPMCRSGRKPSSELCYSCTRTSNQVAYPCSMVIPISFYKKPSLLRELMHNFKEHPDPAVRFDGRKAVAAIVARYFLENGSALAKRYGTWDATVAVPSTHHDRDPALQAAIHENFPDVLAPFERPLGRGTGDMGFNKASETGFVLKSEVKDKSLLLLDDTFTTGARLQSAHHALVAAGATVPIAVIVTRKINPSKTYGNLEMWARQSSLQFDFESPPWWRD